jgi:aspartyl protease family protein
MLTGTIGSRAILIVNGAPPKTVAVGESFQGVKLVSLQAEQAVVELEGKRVNLRMDTPVSIGGGGGSGGGGNRIVLPADSRGHYMTQGTINGRTGHVHARHRGHVHRCRPPMPSASAWTTARASASR